MGKDANFSSKERLIASVLTKTPALKRFAKNIYIRINAVLHKKNYSSKILDSRVAEIVTFGEESFGGYYDKPSMNGKGMVAVNYACVATSGKPCADNAIKLEVCSKDKESKRLVESSCAYTWQQGSRAQWLDDDKLMFNTFEDGKYKAKVFSLDKGSIVKTFDYPVQDAYGAAWFLSINYSRIMALRPDYGYRNLPIPNKDELRQLENDGIWKVDFNTGESKLIHTLKEISEHEPEESMKGALHKVNHLMISKDGKGFIFIHRWYQGQRRFDRLMYSDFKTLKLLAHEQMVSHMCWINDNTVFGYLRLNGINGFYFIDVETGKFKRCDKMTDLGTGDGHPSAHGDWIAFDTYPDKSRMQKLYLYNRKTDELLPLLELFHPVKYSGESRCDLHPRFTNNGKMIFFDSVFTGKRQLCGIDVAAIINE